MSSFYLHCFRQLSETHRFIFHRGLAPGVPNPFQSSEVVPERSRPAPRLQPAQVQESIRRRYEVSEQIKESIAQKLNTDEAQRLIEGYLGEENDSTKTDWKKINVGFAETLEGDGNPREKIKALQRVVFSTLGLQGITGAAIDGIIGPFTMAALAAYAKKTRNSTETASQDDSVFRVLPPEISSERGLRITLNPWGYESLMPVKPKTAEVIALESQIDKEKARLVRVRMAYQTQVGFNLPATLYDKPGEVYSQTASSKASFRREIETIEKNIKTLETKRSAAIASESPARTTTVADLPQVPWLQLNPALDTLFGNSNAESWGTFSPPSFTLV